MSPAGQLDWLGYIALHKKVKGLFAVQYGSPVRGLNRFAIGPSYDFRVPPRRQAIRRLVGKSEAGGGQKGRKNFRKPPFLTRPIASPRHDRGVSAPNGARRGTRTGEIPCCGSGPEPVTGFVGVCSVLSLLFSRCQTDQATPRLTRISSSTPIPEPCCTPPIRTQAGTRHR